MFVFPDFDCYFVDKVYLGLWVCVFVVVVYDLVLDFGRFMLIVWHFGVVVINLVT